MIIPKIRMAVTFIALTMILTPVVVRAGGGGARAMFYDPTLDIPLMAHEVFKQAPETKVAEKKKQSSTQETVAASSVKRKQPAVGLRYWLELQQPNETATYKVDPNRIFRSGERVRLHFSANHDGYIYILQHGSSGSKKLLFPLFTGSAENFLKAGADLATPEPGWFKFDDTVGEERLDIVFFPVNADPAMLDKFKIPDADQIQLGKDLQQLVASQRKSRDLVIEVDSSYFEKYADSIGPSGGQPFPVPGKVPAMDLPPAVYAVNTGQGEYAQPVTVSVVLNHGR